MLVERIVVHLNCIGTCPFKGRSRRSGGQRTMKLQRTERPKVRSISLKNDCIFCRPNISSIHPWSHAHIILLSWLLWVFSNYSLVRLCRPPLLLLRVLLRCVPFQPHVHERVLGGLSNYLYLPTSLPVQPQCQWNANGAEVCAGQATKQGLQKLTQLPFCFIVDDCFSGHSAEIRTWCRPWCKLRLEWGRRRR